MDLNKFVKQLETLADKALQSLDNPDSNSVWSNATRVGGSPLGSIKRSDIEFLIEAAEEHPAPAVKRYVKVLREKYLPRTIMGLRTQIEQKMMLTAKFFDSECGDFEAYLADWFELVLGVPLEDGKKLAKNIVDTYERALAMDLEACNQE